MEYLQNVMNSEYFGHIKDQNHFEKKIVRLIDSSRIVQKKQQDVICEYGSKSNFIYFVLTGKLAVFIPKNEYDLNKQYSVFAGIEKYKRQLNRDPTQVEVQEKLQKLQSEWVKIQKKFDSELINSLKQYQISLKPQINGQEEEFYLEKRKSVVYQTGSLLKKDVCSMKKVGEMSAGDCFGEIGAILDKPRTATIIAMENSTCLVVSYKKYQEIFSQEQIYELNFRVLNLSQIFQEKSVETDVVAHLATHFYKIPPTNIVYREGDKVDGIYLIHSGHVEIFRTQKEYFNSQISIIIKGKGSLIGLEDYFEFDQNSLILNHEKVKINNKKNGRTYSATCKDINMKIYKIDKGILDYFVEGYSHFRKYIITLAHQKFIEYSNKYINNAELKKKLGNLTLVQIPSSSSKAKKNSISNINEQTELQNMQNGLSNSQILYNSEVKQSLNRPEEAQKESNEVKSLVITNQDDQDLKKQSMNFPEIIRYENSKLKDFQQIYEITMKRNKRPQKQDNLSSAKYEAFLKNKFDQQFINHLEHQKKVYENQHLIKKTTNKADDKDDNEIDSELMLNKDNIDFIAKHNQTKSMKYIQQKSRKIKTEKTQNEFMEYSRDYDKDDENQANVDQFQFKKEIDDDELETLALQQQSKNKNLFKYKSMNFIHQPKDLRLQREETAQPIMQYNTEKTISIEKQEMLQQSEKQNDDNQEEQDMTHQLQNEGVVQTTQSLQKIDFTFFSGKRQPTLISYQDSIPLLSNPELLLDLQTKTSNSLIKTEFNINDCQQNYNNMQTQNKEINYQDQKQESLKDNCLNSVQTEKINNFELQQDRSGKKVILRINKNKLDQMVMSPQERSSNVSFNMINYSSNGDNLHHHINNTTSTQNINSGDILSDQYKNNIRDVSNSQNHRDQTPKLRNKQTSLLEMKKDSHAIHSTSQINYEQQQSESTPYSKKESPAQSSQQSYHHHQTSNSLFLPKISGSNNINSASTIESVKQSNKIPPFGYSNQQLSSLNSPPRHQLAKSTFMNSISQLRNTEIFPIKSNNIDSDYKSSQARYIAISKAKSRQSVPQLPSRNYDLSHQTPSKQSLDLLKDTRMKNPADSNQAIQGSGGRSEYVNSHFTKYFYSQSNSKRDSIEAEKKGLSVNIQQNRHSASMIGLENENNTSLHYQNQSMISHNFYNSYIQSAQDNDVIGSQSTTKKIKLRNYLNPNQILNMHTSTLNYSKPTQHLKNLHVKEQIMDDINSKISLFPTKKKTGSVHKESTHKNEHAQSPKQYQQIQNQHLNFTSTAHYINQLDHPHNQALIDSDKITHQSPQRSMNNIPKIVQQQFRSPQSNKVSQVYRHSQIQLNSPIKHLNPAQLALLQKQSKSPGNYISNLFSNKIISGIH